MAHTQLLAFNANLDVDVAEDPTHRVTKIVCTIGPASQSVDVMKRLIAAGASVIRMNFSHGNHDYHRTTVTNARAASEELGIPVAIALDTKGPEIRTGLFVGGKAQIPLGSTVQVTGDPSVRERGTPEKFFIDLPNFWQCVSVGGSIFIDDGILNLKIVSIGDGFVTTVAQNSHVVTDHKGVNLPRAVVNLPAVSAKDREDLRFAVENKVDYIFASFIRSGEMVTEVRAALGGAPIKVISKIENHEGIHNLDSIIEASDGVMVARGDLGVELDAERVIIAQKKIIAKCNTRGKPVICATQMLESMVTNPRPTRAEVSDVANAVLDGADAVMLSGETAKGLYPVEVVQYMARICTVAQAITRADVVFQSVKCAQQLPLQPADAICSSAVNGVLELHAKAIIVLSNTGRSAMLVAKYRPPCIVVAVSQMVSTCQSLALIRGVAPLYYDSHGQGEDTDREKRVEAAIRLLKEKSLVDKGDMVVAVHGHTGTKGFANETRIIVVT